MIKKYIPRKSERQKEEEARIKRGERDGEYIISRVRLALALIYCAAAVITAFVENTSGYNHLSLHTQYGAFLFTFYSFISFLYLRRRAVVSTSFKYICVILDALIISFSICMICAHPERFPPLTALSLHALLFLLIIMLGAFRYNVRCVIFSGIFSALCYTAAVFYNISVIDIPYSIQINGETIVAHFQLYNEAFRILGFAMAGIITGLACARQRLVFSGMLKSESAAARAAGETMARAREVAKTARASADEIFLSSKNIANTANNQAASVKEIENAIHENTRIAAEIAEKTGSVSHIASRTEQDVMRGFSALKQNIDKMSDIQETNNRVINGIAALGNKIIHIRDIVKTIHTITAQTKVIAFNAALEAAGSGGAGRRFAVVADEINRLACDIEALTKQIKDRAIEIQDSSSALIMSGGESADNIEEGSRLIKELEDIFCEIRSGAEITAGEAQDITVSTQKQQKSIEQTNTAVAYIAAGLTSFIHSTEAAASTAGQLTGLAVKIDTMLNTPGMPAPSFRE